jgi:hypothetical protein
MKRFLVSLFALATFLLAVPAHAQKSESFDYIALEVGWFFPTDSLIRDRFSDSILRIGLSPVVNKNEDKWRITYEIGFAGASNDGNRFTVIPLTVGVMRSFGNPEQDFRPYVRVAAGIAYVNFDIDDEDGTGFSPTATAEVGFLHGERFKTSLRYSFVQERDGFDFSGTTLSVSYGLFKF